MSVPVQGYMAKDGTFFFHQEEAEYHDVLARLNAKLKFAFYDPNSEPVNFITFINLNNDLIIEFCECYHLLQLLVKESEEKEDVTDLEQTAVEAENEEASSGSGERRSGELSLHSESQDEELGHREDQGNSVGLAKSGHGTKIHDQETGSEETSDDLESNEADHVRKAVKTKKDKPKKGLSTIPIPEKS